MQTTIYNEISDYFPEFVKPDWYEQLCLNLKSNVHPTYGLVIYNFIIHNDWIDHVVDIGTAEGFSAICAIKGFEDVQRKGSIHTVDIVDRSYSGSATRINFDKYTNYENHDINVQFITGDSKKVIKTIPQSPDLVFHDGHHEYISVSSEIQQIESKNIGKTVHIFDDYHMYDYQHLLKLYPNQLGDIISKIPLVGNILSGDTRVNEVWIVNKRYPGVIEAIHEAAMKYDADLEIIEDRYRAPATILKL